MTRDRILAAALRLVDSGGLEALSMRRLGAALRVDPMAIYHHLPGKDAVLDALVRSVFEAMPAPPARGRWRRRIRSWAHAYRDLALAHPALVLEIVSRPAAVAAASQAANRGLVAALDDAAVPSGEAPACIAAVVDYVNGAVLGGAAARDASPKVFDAGLDVILDGIAARI